MRKIRLFHNPAAGKRSNRYSKEIDEAVSVFEKAGVEVSVHTLQQSISATEEIRAAIVEGCDAVFACGGDGTIHGLIQGLVGTNVALGVIPMGTANALAHDIKVPISSSRAAAQAALKAKERRISVGRIEYRTLDGAPASRYFMIAAGIGMDAAMFHAVDPRTKVRFGMAAYYAAAWRLWFLHGMNFFWAEYDGRPERYSLTQLLAVRISNFGGLLRNLAPGASLERNDFRLVMCGTNSKLSYLNYVLRGIVGTNWKISGIETLFSSEVSCGYTAANEANLKIYVEADGELLGTLPAKISIVPDALTLLSPD